MVALFAWRKLLIQWQINQKSYEMIVVNQEQQDLAARAQQAVIDNNGQTIYGTEQGKDLADKDGALDMKRLMLETQLKALNTQYEAIEKEEARQIKLAFSPQFTAQG